MYLLSIWFITYCVFNIINFWENYSLLAIRIFSAYYRACPFMVLSTFEQRIFDFVDIFWISHSNLSSSNNLVSLWHNINQRRNKSISSLESYNLLVHTGFKIGQTYLRNKSYQTPVFRIFLFIIGLFLFNFI